MIQTCLTPIQLGQLRADELPPEELERIEEHLGECPSCRTLLDEAAADPAGWAELRVSLSDGLNPDHAGDEGPSLEQILKLLGPTDDPRMLGRIGTYEIVGVLGRGGMGVVFKGFDAALNRYVAIKLLQPHLAAGGAARQRFAREAQAAAAVVDDNVMAIHGVAEWQGVPYLVMPYTRGVSLQKRLSEQGPLEVREILRIGMQTASGLAAAHAQGLVHRDVKPANILLADGVERVTLTDFGLARAVDDASLTRTGILAGTPQYMSPEQARGQAVDSRSDLFSLGSVLYALATGRPPFRSDSSYGVLRMITDDQPQPIRELNPDIPAWLTRVIDRLMAKRPEDRFATAREVADLLEKCLAHVQQPLVAPLPAELKPQAKHKSLFLSRRVLAVIVATLVGYVGLFAWQTLVPADIAGEWQGEEWGRVTLKATGDGEYAGTYTDTFGKQPGEIRLKWSWIERRFSGTWKEADDRLGEISVRLVGNEVRGAWTADPKSKINPNTPHLADLLWTRAGSGDPRTAPAVVAGPPVVARSPDRATDPTISLPDPAGGRPAVAGSAGSGDPRTTEDPRTTSPQRINFFTTGHSIHIAASADGKLIAVANGNPTRILQVGGTSRVKGNWKATVEILDAVTEKTVVALKLTAAAEEAALAALPRISHIEATALAFSPAGDAIAVGTSIGQVKLIHPRTGELIRSLDDATARLADKDMPESWKPLARAMGHIESLAFSPDGSLLAVCGGTFGSFADAFDGVERLGRTVTGPGRLKVFEVKTGTLKHDLVGHSYPDVVAFSPDGSLLASAGRWSSESDDGTGVILWNPQTGKKVRTIASQANGGISAVAFSPNGKLVVIGSEMFDKDSDRGSTKITLAHAGTGIVEWQQTIQGWAKPQAFTPDGKSILALAGQSIRLFDVETGKLQRELKSNDLSKDGRYDDFAVTPQSKLIVATVDEEEGNLEVWNLAEPAGGIGKQGALAPAAATPALLFRTQMRDGVVTLAYSPDGSLLAAGGEETVTMLAGGTGAQRWSTSAEVRSLAFSPDGSRLVMGLSWGPVSFVDAQAGDAPIERPRTAQRRPNWMLWGVRISPDGKMVAICGDPNAAADGIERGGLAGEPGGLRIWDIGTTSGLRHELNGHTGQCVDIAFSPDGKLLASAGNWSGPDAASGAILWDPQSGKQVRKIPAGERCTALSVAFSPAGDLLAIGSLRVDKASGASQGAIRLVRPATGVVELEWHTPVAIRPIAFSPDGKWLAAQSDKNVVALWDVATGKAVAEVRPSQPAANQRLEYFAFAPSGLKLAIGGVDPERGGFVEVWSLSAPAARQDPNNPPAAAPPAADQGAAAPMGEASGPSDPRAKPLVLTGHTDWVTGVAFSPDGKRLVSSSRDNTLKMWDAVTGREQFASRRSGQNILDGHRGYVESVAFSPDGKYLASVGDDHEVYLWSASTGRCACGWGTHKSIVMAVAYSPDGSRLATASSDNTVKVWDANPDGHRGGEILSLEHPMPLSVAFSPDGKRLASAGRDNIIRVWNPATAELLLTIKHTDQITCVVFSPDGKRLASAGPTGVQQWDAATGKLVSTLPDLTGISGVAFSPSGKRLATSGWDHVVRLWDASTGQELLTLKGHGNSVGKLAFSPDGKRLASASSDRTIRVWDVTMPGDEVSAPPPAASKDIRLTAEDMLQIQRLLKNAPVTTSYLAEIWELTPLTQAEYRLRSDIAVVRLLPDNGEKLNFVQLGTAYITPSKGVYLQWDAIGASTLHYYGPFYGDKIKQLGIDLDATRQP